MEEDKYESFTFTPAFGLLADAHSEKQDRKTHGQEFPSLPAVVQGLNKWKKAFNVLLNDVVIIIYESIQPAYCALLPDRRGVAYRSGCTGRAADQTGCL